MALIGDFSDTPFADLIQLYTSSRQTVAVTVNLPGGESEGGIFFVENGDVVDGRLGQATGRDAVREALRLSAGSFIVEPDLRTPARTVDVPWTRLLMEETVRIDEEDHPGAEPATFPATFHSNAKARGAQTAYADAPRQAGVPAAGTPARGKPASAASPLASDGTPSRAVSIHFDPRPQPAAPPPTGDSPLENPWLVFLAMLVVLALVGVAVFGLRGRQASAPEAAARPASPRVAATPPAAAGPPTLTFGMASPLSGPDKELGRGMKIGLELAFAEANEAGGVHGKQLALLALDDGNDPAKSAEVMKDLIEGRKVFAVVGNAGTAAAGRAMAVAMERKVAIIGALGGAAAPPEQAPDRYVFAFRPSLAEETTAAVRYLVEVRRVDPADIAVFLQDDEFGQAGWIAAAKQLRAYGRDPSRSVRVGYAHNTADVDGAVDRLVRAGARVKAVVMVASHRPAARLIEKLGARTAGVLFTGVSSVDPGALAEELLSAEVPIADNVILTQVVPLPSSRASAVMHYRALLEKHALGEAPGAISLEGWVVGTLVVEALENAGPDPDSERLVAALEGLRALDLGIGVPLGFSSAEHQASHKIWGAVLQPDGAWKQADLE